MNTTRSHWWNSPTGESSPACAGKREILPSVSPTTTGERGRNLGYVEPVELRHVAQNRVQLLLNRANLRVAEGQTRQFGDTADFLQCNLRVRHGAAANVADRTSEANGLLKGTRFVEELHPAAVGLTRGHKEAYIITQTDNFDEARIYRLACG